MLPRRDSEFAPLPKGSSREAGEGFPRCGALTLTLSLGERGSETPPSYSLSLWERAGVRVRTSPIRGVVCSECERYH